MTRSKKVIRKQPKPTKTFTQKGKFNPNSANVQKSIANFVAQVSENFIAVPDPGALKQNDAEALEKAEAVESSYDDEMPCPDPNCKSPDCKAHAQDQEPPAPDSDDDSDDESESESESESKEPVVEHKFFTRHLSGQVLFWPFILLLSATLLLTISLHAYAHTGFRVTPLYQEVNNCTHHLSPRPKSWFNVFQVYDYLISLPGHYYCRATVAVRLACLQVYERWQYWFVWLFGLEPNEKMPSTLAVPKLKNKHYFLSIPLVVVLLFSIGRRPFLVLRLRKIPAALVFALIFYVFLGRMQIFDFKGWNVTPSKIVTTVRYDVCPKCFNGLPMWRERDVYDYESMITFTILSCWLLFFTSAGPYYKIYFRMIYNAAEKMGKRRIKDKFDTQSRGSAAQHVPHTAWVTSHLTKPFALWRSYDNKRSVSIRDKFFVSVELLKQICNPASMSLIIDDELALERLARSAQTNQTVAISRHDLLDKKQDIYQQTVALGHELRKSFLSKLARKGDLGVSHPP
jgi:hypothetical protein